MDIFDIVAASARVKTPSSSGVSQQSSTYSSGDGFMRSRTGSAGETSLSHSMRPGKPNRLLMSPITQRTKTILKSPRSQRKYANQLPPPPSSFSPDELVHYSLHSNLSPDLTVPTLSFPSRKGKQRAATTSSVDRDNISIIPNSKSNPLYRHDHDFHTTTTAIANGNNEPSMKDFRMSPNASSQSLKSLSSLDARGIVRDVTQATDVALIDDWTRIGMTVLPLFNGEAVHGCMEDLAALVKQCIHERDRSTLLPDFTRILDHGMLNLNAQLQHLPSEDALLPWLADTWHFFHTDVLSYLLCVFMPMQTLLNRRSLDTFNVREQILSSFRDQVFLPISDRIVGN
ncbi:HbrB-like-domain-containing protein [Syncephalis fuscata]|nr:HbrB-like-domain-containing protein [Syncephalis fuscata]